jgi:thiosulfate/3-mercaptopyruvate sulfurtransferase
MSAPHAFPPLIDASTLQHRLNDSTQAIVVVDTSFDLADPSAGERAYAASHLPGSLYAHLDRDLSGAKTGHNGRHPLPDRGSFAATLGRLGIAPGTTVVALDRQAGMFAVRLWWLLRWMGHAEVCVLDGGLPTWIAAGGAVDAHAVTARAQPPYTTCEAGVRLAPTVDADTVLSMIGKRPLIDARAPERFRGDLEPLDAQAGHIPGARNRFFKDNLQPDGRFKPAEVLRAEWLPLLGQSTPEQAVHQCGSGVTACHNLLALAIAGLDGGALYAGSWSEWSSDPRRPIARN